MKWRLFIILMVLVPFLEGGFAAGAAPRGGGQSAKGGEASQITVLSIIPAHGEPGTPVTLSGSGFIEGTVAFLGTQEIPTTVLGPKQLSFEVPQIPPGLYALFLRRPDGVTSKTYSFSVTPLKPAVSGLSPDRVDMCTIGRDRDVVITGQNFQERSQVMLDGAVIRSRFGGNTSIAFTVPNINPGLHQVQVKNSEDAVSGALGLLINAKPEIDSISPAEEYVNYYNLVIAGRNFQQGSTVVVMEESSVEQVGGQYSVDTRRISSSGGSQVLREKIIYVNCNKIIYQRYPYSTALKNFRLQVVNPSGEESESMAVSAP